MGTSSLTDLYALDPIEFEHLVGEVFTALGYEVRLTRRSGDEGIDLELFKGSERSLAQCKRYRGTVGQPDIRDFYGVLIHENAVRGYFVTTGQFSLAASTWAQGKPIALIDGIDFLAALDNSGIAPPVSLAPADEQAAGALMAARRSPEERLAQLHQDHLAAALHVLSASERSVIESRYGLSGRSPQAPEESSDQLSMTLEGVRRTEAQALEKLSRATAPDERSPEAIGEWNEEHVLRVSREQTVRALISKGTTVEEQATRERVKACLASLTPVERLVIEMWSGFKDDHQRDIDTVGDQLGQPIAEIAAIQVEALEKIARRWSDSWEVGEAVFATAEAARERKNEAHWKFRGAFEMARQQNEGDGPEAEFILRFSPASVLEAHCGNGRIARALTRRGVDIVGVEPLASALNLARKAARHLDWRFAQVLNIDLDRSFDAVVMADDGILTVALGSEALVVANLARHLRAGGVLIVSFHLVPDLLTVSEYDELAAQAGLVFVERWSSWECDPWSAGSDYSISVHRKP